MKRTQKLLIIVPAVLLFATTAASGAQAQGTINELVTNLFGESTQTIDIIVLLTLLSLLPSILIMLTSFTRIIIVMSFMRNALGMQQTPPNQVLIGLALFLTFFVMYAPLKQIYDEAYTPYTEDAITQDEFFDTAIVPIRRFMLSNTKTENIDFFLKMTDTLDGEYESYDDLPMAVLIPAFLMSEIKAAFTIGFFIYIPFIVIDMVVASTLMAMGMMMLPPAMISLPFKVLLFLMVDGWQLVFGTIVNSFNY